MYINLYVFQCFTLLLCHAASGCTATTGFSGEFLLLDLTSCSYNRRTSHSRNGGNCDRNFPGFFAYHGSGVDEQKRNLNIYKSFTFEFL